MFGDAADLLDEPGKSGNKDFGSGLTIKPLTNVKKAAHRRTESSFKKPEGMHRELFNLISSTEKGAVSLQSVLPVEPSSKYHTSKIKLGLREVRRYKWIPFVNEARTDGLKLFHWQRTDRIDPNQPYPFARFNKIIKIPGFTDEEYDKHLKSAKWTREETRYLFDVCRQFDIRWPIVHDRYDVSKFGVQRSMEDMKERFYSIVNELAHLKDPSAELVNYDADNERRRKEQLLKQWNRTKEELEEEEMLINELKRIETRKKEREKKAHDLQKLINMADAPASPSVSGVAMSPAVSKKKNQLRQKTGSLLGSSNALLSSLDICATSSLRFPEFKSAGPHLRSQEMKLPTNVGQKKLKNIETVLQKCRMEMNPNSSETISVAYNEFRQLTVHLIDLKATLQSAEFELESIRSKMQAKGMSFEIEPRMRISTLIEGGLEEAAVSGDPGAPSTSRRITSYIDVSSSTNPLGNMRKRKSTASTVPTSSMELKRSRRS